MDENNNKFNEFLNNWIYVVLKSGRKYAGIVNSIENNLVYITDKYNNLIMFNVNDISSMEVQNEH